MQRKAEENSISIVLVSGYAPVGGESYTLIFILQIKKTSFTYGK
ncbi:hypothetical protein [Cytobacillus gottheilii]|nr:hypothetical protein [Cytobacillus gottheilii]